MAVIECVRGGLNVGGVVSFHGLLQTGEDPNAARNDVERPPVKRCENNYNRDAVILIENGADDALVPDSSKQRFFDEMDAAGVPWVFHHHAKTPHGFALPPTLGPPGRLHEATDRRSTMSMLNLFQGDLPRRAAERGCAQRRGDFDTALTFPLGLRCPRHQAPAEGHRWTAARRNNPVWVRSP